MPDVWSFGKLPSWNGVSKSMTTYRSRTRRRRATLNPRQQRLKEKWNVAQLRANILCAGIAPQFERIYDMEEFEHIRSFVNGELFDAMASARRADEAFTKSVQSPSKKNPPRSEKPSTASRQDQPIKKGKKVKK